MKAYLKTIGRRWIAALLSLLFCLPAVLPIDAAESPSVTSAKTALLYCVESETVLYAKGENEKVAPGALTKLMVAVTAIEIAEKNGVSLDSYVTASRAAIRATAGPHIAMKTGEQFRLRDLLAVMLHVGADDAAHVIAEHFGTTFSGFVSLMNETAERLGMTDTVFTNVTGMPDEGMVTTPNDLLKLTLHALQYQFLLETAMQYRVVIDATNLSSARYYGTMNYLVSSRVDPDYYLSMATGLVCGNKGEAGYSAIATARKNALTYVAIVTGAGTHKKLVSPETIETDPDGNETVIPAVYKTVYDGLHEARELLLWGEKSFCYINAVDSATPIVELPVSLANGVDHITLLPSFGIDVYVPSDIDRDKEITYTYTLTETSLTAPIKAGTEYGTLSVYYRGELLGEVPLVAANNIERSGWLSLLHNAGELMSSPFFLVLIALVIFAAFFYVISTAITRQRKAAERRRALERRQRYLK